MSILKKIFKRKNKLDKYVLCLDIGTEFVKVLIFKVDPEEEKGVVVAVGKEHQRLSDIHSGVVTDIEGVVTTCDRAISQAEKQAGVRPEQAIIGIAGELVKGSTTYISYKRENPETGIDMGELKYIVQKVQWQAFDKIRKDLAWETGLAEIDIKLINAAIVDVRIDGYRINNPLGFQGKEVSIGVFNAYAPLVHLGALQTIAAMLSLDLLNIAVEPYALARCTGIDKADNFSAIFIDIGGGTSDIAVVRNGGIEGTKMFAVGGRTFTNRIAQNLGIGFNEAEDIKLRYSNGELGKEVTKKIHRILEGDMNVWLSGIELCLAEFSNLELLPSKILLCGGSSQLPLIQEALHSNKWIESLPFAKKPEIYYIKPEEVVNIIDETKKLKNVQDITPMALASNAIELAGEDDVLSGILKKVIRMMQT